MRGLELEVDGVGARGQGDGDGVGLQGGEQSWNAREGLGVGEMLALEGGEAVGVFVAGDWEGGPRVEDLGGLWDR